MFFGPMRLLASAIPSPDQDSSIEVHLSEHAGSAHMRLRSFLGLIPASSMVRLHPHLPAILSKPHTTMSAGRRPLSAMHLGLPSCQQ